MLYGFIEIIYNSDKNMMNQRKILSIYLYLWITHIISDPLSLLINCSNTVPKRLPWNMSRRYLLFWTYDPSRNFPACYWDSFLLKGNPCFPVFLKKFWRQCHGSAMHSKCWLLLWSLLQRDIICCICVKCLFNKKLLETKSIH